VVRLPELAGVVTEVQVEGDSPTEEGESEQLVEVHSSVQLDEGVVVRLDIGVATGAEVLGVTMAVAVGAGIDDDVVDDASEADGVAEPLLVVTEVVAMTVVDELSVDVPSGEPG